MDKRFCLYIISQLLYVCSLISVGAFFIFGTTGNTPNWRWDILVAAGACAFLGLVGDVVSEIADQVSEMLQRSRK
jgi:hypothetical protein